MAASDSSSTSTSSPPSTAPRYLKLCYLGRAKLLPLSSLETPTFSRLLTLAAQTFPETQCRGSPSSSPPRIELSFSDEDGDTVLLDSDESFALAAPSLLRDEVRVIKLQVHLRGSQADAQDRRPTGKNCSISFPAHSPARATPSNLSNHTRRRIPCRHFQTGRCRFGSSCKFSHDVGDHSNSINRINLVSDEFEIDRWLATLSQVSEHDFISRLTSPEGYEIYLRVLNHPRLRHANFHELVRSLTRPKLRRSMLKQATDRIYHALLGSHFMNVMHSHIRGSVKPILNNMEPYVWLCEELMSRTSEGWREVPLDELKALLEEVQDDSVTDLANVLARLLDHRTQKKRLEAVDERSENSSPVSNFRDMPIIPPKEQILGPQNSHQLPMNLLGLRYPNIGAYLETHFRLMQEDCIASLREGINELSKGLTKVEANIHIYRDVRLVGLQCSKTGMVFDVSFKPNTRRPIDWRLAKRLMFGSLLCMSCDKFHTLLWAVVAKRTVEELNKRVVSIQILQGSERMEVLPEDTYLMVESSAAYFEAYSHVLRSLQRPEMDELPFQQHFVALEPNVKQPAYLKERDREDVYDFEGAFPEMRKDLRTTQFHILQNWPDWQNSLDESQMSALKHGLTKRLALIQGPPGTGKTFVGLLIVRLLLANLKRCTFFQPFERKETNITQGEDTIGGPILLICYTNHALDQFLEKIYVHEKNVVRIGGRSKSVLLEDRKLQKLQVREVQCWTDSIRAELNRIIWKKKGLEEQIERCVYSAKQDYITREMLEGIATEEQVTSLFYDGCDTEAVVQMWLFEQEKRARNAGHVNTIQQSQSSMQNRFDVLETLNDSDSMGESSAAVEESAGIFARREISEVSSFRFEHHTEIEDGHKDDTACRQNEEDQWKASENRSSQEPSVADTVMKHLVTETSDPEIHNDEVDRKKREDGFKATATQAEKGAEYGPAELGWTDVKPRFPKPNLNLFNHKREKSEKQNKTILLEQNIELLQKQADLWSLHGDNRRALHTFWMNKFRQNLQESLDRLHTEYAETCQKRQELEDEIQVVLLRKAKIVGMTTTAAARYRSVLDSLRPEIIVVEEAAEVLESHIVACLTASTKHLILIGDHLQLRPSVAVHKLAVKHKLDVSLFERLVKGGVEYVTLEVQRRMRPSISRLISGIYPMLKDHESVSAREDIKGLKSSVFFLHHTFPEEHQGDDDSGKLNIVEAQFVVELCVYLLRQQYSHHDITILSMYRGQTQEICRQLARKLQAKQDTQQWNLPRVSSVDDYQGEECKIIILSLVRNNWLATAGLPGKIGFLAVSNRMCVALSRAQDGLFVFGNGTLLSEKSKLWEGVVKNLQQSNSYGDALVLTCQKHQDWHFQVRQPSDFQHVPDGGCDKSCDYQLDCGHACPKRCHPGGHDKIVCPKRCPHKHPLCNHQCQKLCHGFDDCPPCLEKVTKVLPACGHSVKIPCSLRSESVTCQTPCPKVLICSHMCQKKCGERCTSFCNKMVEQALPCCHQATLACHKDPSAYLCEHPCQETLPDCQHRCQGSCGACKQGQEHVPCKQKCDRALPCGHPCAANCHQVCPPCKLPCQKRCGHSRCQKPCGYPCVNCMEPCLWTCEHHTCKMLCHALCTRPCCKEACPKLLKCGHPCLGFCGEPCPSICRFCTHGFTDSISLMTMSEFEESDRFVELQDCGHVFEVSGLDTWMQPELLESAANGISPKSCPECRTPIRRSFRYGNLIKAKLQQLEQVKHRILQIELTNEGIKLLRQKQYGLAVSKFVAAIERDRTDFEARLGLGSALCLQNELAKGIQFFQSVVYSSVLRSAISEIQPWNSYVDENILIEQWETRKKKVSLPPPGREADKKLATRALVQWAVALSSNVRYLPGAQRACELALREEPGNREARQTLKAIVEGRKVQQEVVDAMMTEVGKRGHWYQCPNGHLYVVGECGGPTQVSRCPDCGATVGGQNHAPAAGNRHSSIDGSAHSAWSNRVGLGD